MTYARRVQQIRARWRVRRWEYRQRNLAHGAWGKFREALALASEAYVIGTATAAMLAAEGFQIDSRGSGFEPPRQIVWISSERASGLGADRIPLRIDAALLSAPALALVAFP